MQSRGEIHRPARTHELVVHIGPRVVLQVVPAQTVAQHIVGRPMAGPKEGAGELAVKGNGVAQPRVVVLHLGQPPAGMGGATHGDIREVGGHPPSECGVAIVVGVGIGVLRERGAAGFEVDGRGVAAFQPSTGILVQGNLPAGQHTALQAPAARKRISWGCIRTCRQSRKEQKQR